MTRAEHAVRQILRERRRTVDALAASLPARKRGQHRGPHPWRRMGWLRGRPT